MSDPVAAAVVAIVVLGRLGLPLLIFRFPLPGILVCLVLDGFDQTIFQQFSSIDLDGYQAYDKALDIFYLAMAYIATMRNWTSVAAFKLAQLLFYFRLVGVAAFELSGGRHEVLLLIFPNTFEFFFIFYEAVRVRWDPARRGTRFWIVSAAGIWIVIKIPQEYWIHVAKLDTTELAADHPIAAVLVAITASALLVAAANVLRAVAPPGDHSPQLAANPVPVPLGGRRQRIAYRLSRDAVLDRRRLEKIVLISFVWTIFTQFLPGVDAGPAEVTVAVGVLVTVNSLLGLLTARRGDDIGSVALSFAALACTNLVFVFALRAVIPTDGTVPAAISIFLLLLLSLIVTLYDRFRPIIDARARLLTAA